MTLIGLLGLPDATSKILYAVVMLVILGVRFPQTQPWLLKLIPKLKQLNARSKA